MVASVDRWLGQWPTVLRMLSDMLKSLGSACGKTPYRQPRQPTRKHPRLPGQRLRGSVPVSIRLRGVLVVRAEFSASATPTFPKRRLYTIERCRRIRHPISPDEYIDVVSRMGLVFAAPLASAAPAPPTTGERRAFLLVL